MHIPRLVISGLSGGSGKTLLSLGLARAFARQGLIVQPCKKGPDYIDAAWLSLAARRVAANLDPCFLDADGLRSCFLHACTSPRRGPSAELALVEGNRGLYDGRDTEGSCSTARVAGMLDAPVLLVINCAKMTRTSAALVAGVRHFEADLRLAGVIVNNTGSDRHATQVRQAIEHYTNVPVLGTLPRLRDNPLPERHMGLRLDGPAVEQEAVLERLADYTRDHVDLTAVLAAARSAPPFLSVTTQASRQSPTGTRPVIGFVRDDALWFYYEENLEALRDAGADLVELSLLAPAPWPRLDGLYLGGGFPELFGSQIAASPHLEHIRELARQKKPIYAECGGFMVLCQSLHCPDSTYAMTGLLPASTRFFSRPQGLGYVEAVAVHPNPFHPTGTVWRGHEFHYSRCEMLEPEAPLVLNLRVGVGMGRTDKGACDGLSVGSIFASYTHLFAPAVPHWAVNFVRAAEEAADNH